ncbi:chemerin-like receptor 1 [Discoglossus pictus]
MDSMQLSEKLCYFFWDLNSTSDFDSITTKPDGPSILQYTSFVLSVLFCAIGLVGNVIVIYISGFRLKGSKSRIWFLNLAVADLVFLLFLPINATSELKGYWPYGLYVCKLYHFLSNINMYASIFIITALNIDRVLAVSKPIWYQQSLSPQVSYVTCGLIWAVTIIASLPAFIMSNQHIIHKETQCILGYTEHSKSEHNIVERIIRDSDYESYKATEEYVKEVNFSLAFNPGRYAVGGTSGPSFLKTFNFLLTSFTNDCIDIIPSSREQCSGFDRCAKDDEVTQWGVMMLRTQMILIPLIVMGYMIPLCVIIICNCVIALKVKKSQTIKPSTLYRIIVTVVIVYFITWTPLHIAQVIYLVAARDMNFPLMFKINAILPLLSSIAYSNSCLNPIVYVFVGKKVRRTLIDMMTSLRKLTSTTNS